MNHIKSIFTKTAAARQGKSVIETTLYQLVEAVSEEIPFDDDRMVTMIVDDILNTAGVCGVAC